MNESWVIEHAMQEDGLHGIDGWRVVRGSEAADDSFSSDQDTAQAMADRLNDEDGLCPLNIFDGGTK